MVRRLWISPFLFVLFVLALPAEVADNQAAVVENLERQLLAPCCWSETLHEHRSEIALQMKAEIRAMVAAGKTDREILDHYKEQYGMRILVEPEGRLFWVMNVVPVVALFLGGLAVALILRRWLKNRPLEDAPV